MSDENECGIQIGQLRKILGEKKTKLSRDLEFEKKFQQSYGLNESRSVDEIEKELKAVEQLEKDICNEDWCRKVKALQQPPAAEPGKPKETEPTA